MTIRNGFLELQGVGKCYGDTPVVSDCSLSISEGEFICLLGPSGCGKTTTLQMIAGFVEPTAGQIRLNGRDITTLKPNQRGLGVVFQSYALFPHMTVGENIAFGLEMRRIEPGERRRRVQEALELVQLGALAGRYPKELSGGQRQRVALARALVIQPPVLLLDEPMGALDAKLREEMQIELRALQHRVGITTIMVTHDQAEAMTMADRVVLMEKGRVKQIDRPVDMYEKPNGRFASTFLGKANVFEVDRPAATSAIRFRGCSFPVDNTQAAGALDYIVRPEKVQFAEAATALVKGRVSVRLFLGNHWLYQVDTPAGLIQLTQPNLGAPTIAEGDEVGLRWAAEHVRLVPRGAEIRA
ncbi:MAG: ABC transporter ATP-binding protein [Ramlibacter sp.]